LFVPFHDMWTTVANSVLQLAVHIIDHQVCIGEMSNISCVLSNKSTYFAQFPQTHFCMQKYKRDNYYLFINLIDKFLILVKCGLRLILIEFCLF
jgi:hypothetical protein